MWLEVYKRPEIKGSSCDRLENTAVHQIFPELGGLCISCVSCEDIQRLLVSLRDKRLSYSTVKKSYDCLNTMYIHEQ